MSRGRPRTVNGTFGQIIVTDIGSLTDTLRALSRAQ